MNTTKSLMTLAVALIATCTIATAVSADDAIVLSSHQTEQAERDSIPIHIARDCSNGRLARDRLLGRRAHCDESCGVADSCPGGACGDGRHVLGSHAGGAGIQGLLAQVHYAAQNHTHSGQPLIDPWARADWIAQQRAARQSWHAGYYHTAWGSPVALMVAPTARMQTRWGWGVAQSTVSPIYPQYKRPYPDAVGGGMGGVIEMGTNPLLPTPRWPSHTDQFGVYYVRGPW
jgi:hypothetical protein